MSAVAFDYDVVIVGAGIVGATLACLLAKQGSRVAVVERYTPTAFALDSHHSEHYGLRVSAISRASQQVFIQAGAWEAIVALRVAPYEAMHVWDATGNGEIHFSAAEIGEADLGVIIENQVIEAGLLATMKTYEQEQLTLLAPVSVTDFHSSDENADVVHITLSNGKTITTALLVGADGAQSKVRALANIGVQKNSYHQKGLVAVVHTEKSHQLTAWQRFMPSGPLAFLPLGDEHLSSIVWTLPADKADYYLTMSNETFDVAISHAFDHRLGQVKVVSERVAFPLVGQQATHYIAAGVALVGDAAHTIHPLAGQGVNLGIKDAVVLAHELASMRTSRTSSVNKLVSLKTLRRYERARRGDNVMMQKAMEGFKLLFGNTFTPLQLVRNMGLNTVDRITPVKNTIIRRAMGL